MTVNFIQSQIFSPLVGANCKLAALAISGGADSMCMAKLASLSTNVKFVALIVDHGLRKESAAEAALVQKRLKAIGLETVILKWNGKKPKSNIQEVARNARYELLFEYCKQHNIKHLFVAHTKNDQAETVLMRILRGTGVDGVSGMKVKEKRNGITILRPLLAFSRGEILKTLKYYKVKWVEDPSNANEKYKRIKLRNLINAQEDAAVWLDRFTLLASNARRTREFLDSEVKKFIKEKVEVSDYGYVKFKISDFNIHDELKFRVLSKLLMIVSGKRRRHRLSSLENLNLNKSATLWDCVIKPKGKVCYIFKEARAVRDGVLNGIWDNRFKVKLSKTHIIHAVTKEDWKILKDKVTMKPEIHEIVYSMPVVYNKSGKLLGFPMIKNLDVEIDFIKNF